jgi:hypothetical protein
LVTATLKSYRPKDSFTSIIVQVEGQDLASVFLLETSAHVVALNNAAITDRKALVASDLDGILAKLAEPKGKHWDVRTSFQSMAAYYNANPDKQLVQFFDNIELGNVQLAKPSLGAGPGEGKTVQTPRVPNQPAAGTQPPPPAQEYANHAPAGQPMQIAPPRSNPPRGYESGNFDDQQFDGIDPRDPRLRDPQFRQWLANRQYQLNSQRRRQGMPAPLPPPGYYGQRPQPLPPPPGQNFFQNFFGPPQYGR